MKVVFFHDSLPSYRIPFFNSLGKKVELKIVFFNIDVSEKIYGEKSDLDLLSGCTYSVIDKTQNIKSQIEREFSADTDLVHLSAPDGKYELYVCWLCLQAAQRRGIRTAIYWVRWNEVFSLVPYKQRFKNVVRDLLAGPLVRKTDVCLSVGIKSKEHFRQLGVKEERIRHIHYATDVSFNAKPCDIYDTYDLDRSEKYILYLGRVVERKGLLDLIQAYEKSNLKRMRLLIAGTGKDYLESCREYVSLHKMKNVIFLGQVPSDIRKHFFTCCEIFVLPSILYKGITEPWGQTVTEALQCGCRVIASDAVGAAFELINEENGIIYRAGNVDELCCAIKKLASMPVDRQKIISSVQDYTCENMATDVVDAYHFALG